MCRKEKDLHILNTKLRCFYKERSQVRKLLENTRKAIQKKKMYTPRSILKIVSQNDEISHKLNLIDFYLSKIDYLNTHILKKKIEQDILFNDINNMVDVQEISYNYYPPICIEAILGRYDKKAAWGCFFLF